MLGEILLCIWQVHSLVCRMLGVCVGTLLVPQYLLSKLLVLHNNRVVVLKSPFRACLGGLAWQLRVDFVESPIGSVPLQLRMKLIARLLGVAALMEERSMVEVQRSCLVQLLPMMSCDWICVLAKMV